MQPQTLGELRRAVDAGRMTRRSIRDEVRENLARRLRDGVELFPGIIGYDDTVVPQLINAILSRHHFILLGLRGQAKSRILRSLVSLLDETIPVMPGCEINDDPLAPLCSGCRRRIAAEGDATPIAWRPRDLRYVEKLATPDVTIADIVGDIDPIKAARGGLQLSDELTMHFGLLPRANRGIFAINELPDLAGKIQVGLFNILQEGDIQIKGYPVRLPLDVLMVFSANPEDYTARGKIITPLKDRIGSEIRTHYPATRALSQAITAQEAWVDRAHGSKAAAGRFEVPAWVREIVEEIAFQARADSKIDKRSGVSQRLPISVLENVVSNAERRALLSGEDVVVPRVTDVYSALPSITGKFELEYEGELRGAGAVASELIRAAVSNVATGYLDRPEARPVVEWFDSGGSLQITDTTSARQLIDETKKVPGLHEFAAHVGGDQKKTPSAVASAIDFVLEGLYAQKKISRSDDWRYAAGEQPRRAQGRAADTSFEQGIPTPNQGRKNYTTDVRYKYTKYVGDPFEGIDLEDLVSKLSDLLLSSGFEDPYDPQDTSRSQSMQALYDAILDALLNGGLLDEDAIERLMGDPADSDSRSQLEQLIDRLIEGLARDGYITPQPDLDAAREQREGAGGGDGPDGPPVRFEVTDKSLDFLGYRALRDLLGSLGKSHFGRHDTRDFSTGVETSGAPKPWEFGDTMNLDPSATILNAVQRAGSLEAATAGGLVIDRETSARGGGSAASAVIDVHYDDLVVVQGEYQSSCATVLMLDCSHSMILYGEDRFTPAKRVAMALANLIRHQYPGDALKVVLFHDSAEEVPLQHLPRVRVGPHYTNTREGLRLARRILERERKDMRQIIMITDGKPSAITRTDGRIYRNAFGLDPFIVQETFAEVAACRRAGIMINTFMLARDYDLVAFVRKVAEICHGKAYFTTPRTLGRYVLLDYLNRKTRTVH